MLHGTPFPLQIAIKNTQGGRQMFSAEEDFMLKNLVARFGDKDWKIIAENMPNRTTKQCRERYKNYLSPNIRNDPWTPEEDKILIQKYSELGPKWSTIASFLDRRSDVNIKNRWTSLSCHHTKKLQMQQKEELSNKKVPNQSTPPISQGNEHNGMILNSGTVPQTKSNEVGAIDLFSPASGILSQDLKTELIIDKKIEKENLKSTFLNYGGKYW
ncbi:Myb-like DNA-binding domain containing protein [Histomonas meleagridis]|uniref:Myb-like DNA-binding domain containing protein n=1 Tax=Histomonas meleagridis TaxID=135588 RepID=UPI0035597B0E|nr:Myb-like DNA-binding domain containing protein [Histomonas meleagridis]KAH0797571.1 Myb-like DNA-binding domain containing protein [Histomonas meleagridis]